ncbi:hypothetical protein BV898_16586 [Hypsibius exemplaris]|uniref:UPAR/Ly6 domain-containing protein n=1 Tax=Hypsibius exemplaris TaxID=2072580 RepID=A0A9X6NDG9_HYPEX|nr:hypothetical protein BV898_16586 [Hypsibius exemplaris]
MGRFLVLALTVTFMVAYASALSCYQCQYTDGEAESVANQKNCADTFNSQNIATSTTVSGMDCASCVAIKSTYKGKVTTMRTCRPDGVLSGPGVPVGCTTDNCNNGTASEYPVSQLPAPATDLSCYQCAYDGDIAEHAFNQRNCADPFKPEGINKIIAIGGMGCVTCINGKAIVNGKTVTQRTCMPFDIPAGIGGLETCMTNNCNGGTAPLVTIPPLPAAALQCYECAYVEGEEEASSINQVNSMTIRRCITARVDAPFGAPLCTTDNCNTGPAPIITEAGPTRAPVTGSTPYGPSHTFIPVGDRSTVGHGSSVGSSLSSTTATTSTGTPTGPSVATDQTSTAKSGSLKTIGAAVAIILSVLFVCL